VSDKRQQLVDMRERLIGNLGEPIALTLYREAEAVAMIALPPIRALALAGELIGAAIRRLAC